MKIKCDVGLCLREAECFYIWSYKQIVAKSEFQLTMSCEHHRILSTNIYWKPISREEYIMFNILEE